MSMLSAASVLLIGVLAVLFVATLVGEVLAHHGGPDARDPVIENLNDRIMAWWVMTALIAIAFATGRYGFLVLFGLASFMALREFLTLLQTRRGDHLALLSAFFVVLPLQYYLIAIEWYGLYSIFIPVYAFLALPVLAAIRGDTSHFMERVSEVQWALMVCVFCVSHVPALATLDIPGFDGQQLLLIAFLLIVVQGSDVLQYIWGKLLGRRKIAPSLSPSKTVEGFVGGMISATGLGAALWWITPFSVWQAAGMALVIAVLGFFGGLVMSAIKRDRGIKDWSDMISGHGGLLDRLDSIIFAAPVFFHLTRFWFTP